MKFNYKKKFGQNFLNDDKIIFKIANEIKSNGDDLIIEIGPGMGSLTKELAKKESYLLCYEIDEDLKLYLDKINKSNFTIIYGDFLKRDILDDIKDINYNNLYVVGNLPYYITSPIILKLIDNNINFKSAVFMVQDEVADRFASFPGNREYGSISVLLNYYFDVKKLFIVNRNKFYPVPNVDSAVIRLDKKEKLLDVDTNKFKKLVKDSFQFKRKNLRNNLKNYDLEKINFILQSHGYDLNNRAEDLYYEVFVDIANKY